MSKAGLAGFQLAGDELITLAGSLTDDEWHTPSAAEGWSVQDVVGHAGSLWGAKSRTAAVPGNRAGLKRP
jgi:hypothetical protein